MQLSKLEDVICFIKQLVNGATKMEGFYRKGGVRELLTKEKEGLF